MTFVVAYILGLICGYLIYDALAQYQDYQNLRVLDDELARYYKEENND